MGPRWPVRRGTASFVGRRRCYLSFNFDSLGYWYELETRHRCGDTRVFFFVPCHDRFCCCRCCRCCISPTTSHCVTDRSHSVPLLDASAVWRISNERQCRLSVYPSFFRSFLVHRAHGRRCFIGKQSVVGRRRCTHWTSGTSFGENFGSTSRPRLGPDESQLQLLDIGAISRLKDCRCRVAWLNGRRWSHLPLYRHRCQLSLSLSLSFKILPYHPTALCFSIYPIHSSTNVLSALSSLEGTIVVRNTREKNVLHQVQIFFFSSKDPFTDPRRSHSRLIFV